MQLVSKNYILGLVAVTALLFSSCKKDDDNSPTADLSTEAVGVYNITKLTYDGDSEDVKGMGYTIEVTRVKDNTVSMNLEIGLDFEVEDIPLGGKSGAITFKKKEDGDSLEGTISGKSIKVTSNVLSIDIVAEGAK